MAKRIKKYKGIVIQKFRVSGTIYKTNDSFETSEKHIYDYLINNKKLKS
jgi:hypothetical protein